MRAARRRTGRTMPAAWLPALCIALLSALPCAGRAAGASCGAPERFAWVAADAAGARSGRLDVVELRSGRTVQRIEVPENYFAGQADGGVESLDLNNDGCADLIVTRDMAAIGNRMVTVYLYDRARRRFVPNKALSDIGDPTLDERDPNCVIGLWRGGAEDFYSSRHCWRGGRLVLVSDYSQTPLYDKASNEFACYEVVETTYTGKRKHERRRCTKRP